ncbi:MAG TPA: hypothetical protein VGK48_03720 [Terriglobia bacterium]|jgi:hypothetical protein
MSKRRFWVFSAILCLGASLPAVAQVSHDARLGIIRTVLADQVAARVGLPFGSEGVELSDTGQINQEKLTKEIQKNGQSVEAGKVITITDITFEDKEIIVVLDGGGKNKKNILDRIQIGVGTDSTGTVPVRDDRLLQAKGSKVVLKFAKKAPADLTPEQFRQLLDPVLDFNKQNVAKSGIAALPPEFQEAVKAKEAKIGMDRGTVIMAMGRPDNKFTDPAKPSEEQWMYVLRGLRRVFVTFENNIVVQVKLFQPQ